MALSGSIGGTAGSSGGSNPGHKPSLSWSAKHSGGNTIVTVSVKYSPLTGATWGTFSGTVTVGGTSKSVSGSVSASSAGTIAMVTFTFSGTGSKSLAAKLTGSIPGTSGWTSTSLSGTMSVSAASGSTSSAPANPTNIVSTVSGTSIKITFSKGARATSTRIQRSTNGGSWVTLTTTTGTSYTNTGLTRGSTYRYRLISVNSSGTSSGATTALRTIAAATAPEPTNFTLTRQSGDEVLLAWTKASGADTTRVRLNRNDGDFTTLVEVTGNSRLFSGAPNSKYIFNVRSVNSGGASTNVTSAPFYTSLPDPGTPVLETGGVLKLHTSANYVTYMEVDRQDGATDKGIRQVAVTQAILTNGWTDPTAVAYDSTYRVRFYAGDSPPGTPPAGDPTGVWSEWSEWCLPNWMATRQPPELTYVKAERWNTSTNTADDEGNKIAVTTSGFVDAILNTSGVAQNRVSVAVDIRRYNSGTDFTPTMWKNNANTGFVWSNQRVVLATVADPAYAWEIRVRLWDSVSSGNPLVRVVVVPAITTPLSIGEDGIGVNKLHNGGALDVKGTSLFAGNITQSTGVTHVARELRLWTGGVSYRLHGTAKIDSVAVTTATGSTYRSEDVTVPMPVDPPDGWRYEFGSVAYAGAYGVWGQMRSGATSKDPKICIMATTSRTLSNVYVPWSLVLNE